MTEIHNSREIFDKMRTWRDEFKLKAHLLKSELKSEWEKQDVKSSARKIAHHIHDRYSKFKRTFTEGAR